MRQDHIESMVRKLSPILKDKSKASRILKKYWQDKMALVWSVRDVHTAANERGVAVTRKEAVRVLQTLLLHHNKQYGIRWEDLTTHIEEQCIGRKLTKPETSRFVTKNIITINQ